MMTPPLGLLFALIVAAGEPKKLDFAHDVLPLLKARCAECHSAGKYKGGLSLDTREDLLKSKIALPGKSQASELLRRVSSKDPEQRMPPKGPALTEKEVAILKTWIDVGLPWQEGFSFKAAVYVAPLKPRRPTLPPVKPGLEHPIDRLLDSYFAKQKTTAPPPADDVAFVRRAYLDLIGQLPTPAEIDDFAKSAESDKRNGLVRRLLSEKRGYADHWLSFWNDLLRNDYAGTGYIDGGRKQISGWLYQALVDNKPYDQFVRDLLTPAAGAEGFSQGIKWRGNVNASQVREVQFSQNVSQVFFGANLKCASCHDSFIDSWKLDDAYSLAAVIADKPLAVHRCDKPTGQTAKARFLWPELGTIDPDAPKAKRLEQFAELTTHPDNGRFTRTIANRLWQRLLGRGLVHPVDVMANRPWNEDLLDYLAVYLSDNGYDLKKLLEHIATSKAYQAQSARWNAEAGEEYVFKGPEVRRVSAEQFLDAVWQITHSVPAKTAAPVSLAPFEKSVPVERQFSRSSLMTSNALMRSLGRPNREQVVTTRPDVLTTLQALDFANGQLLADALDRGAQYLLKTHGKNSPDELIAAVYTQALSRRPTADEMATARAILGSPMSNDGVADLLWCAFMLPEFQLIR